MSYKHYNNGPGIFSMNDVYFSHLIDSAGPDAGGGGWVFQGSISGYTAGGGWPPSSEEHNR